MTFIFDGGKVLRCEACGFRMYLGPWDLLTGLLTIYDENSGAIVDSATISLESYECIPCGAEMIQTHVGGPDGWVEIEAVPA